jgi:hypothetical protein
MLVSRTGFLEAIEDRLNSVLVTAILTGVYFSKHSKSSSKYFEAHYNNLFGAGELQMQAFFCL